MLVDPLDIGTKDRRAWSYLPGQRRVKVAPDLAYDTPNPGTAGATTFDDTFIFNGSMDRFDFKLVGKKEMSSRTTPTRRCTRPSRTTCSSRTT